MKNQIKKQQTFFALGFSIFLPVSPAEGELLLRSHLLPLPRNHRLHVAYPSLQAPGVVGGHQRVALVEVLLHRPATICHLVQTFNVAPLLSYLYCYKGCQLCMLYGLYYFFTLISYQAFFNFF